MSHSILEKKRQKQHILVIFKLCIGWEGVETMDAIYWINWLYKLIIYRRLDHNEISSIGDNTVDHVPSLLIHSRGFAYYLWVKFGRFLIMKARLFIQYVYYS
jgi:hypothetical protein